MNNQNQMKVQAEQENIKEVISNSAKSHFEKLLKKITNEPKTLKIADAFTDHGDDVLYAIQDDFKNKQKNDGFDKNIYKTANEAFKEDIQTTQDKLKDEKNIKKNYYDDVYTTTTSPYEKKTQQLTGLLSIVNEIDGLIEETKTAEEKTAEQEKQNQTTTMNLLSLNYDSKESAKRFFETSKEDDYNTVMEQIFGENEGNEITPATITKAKNTAFRNIIEQYAGTTNLGKVELGKANKEFGTLYPEGTRVLEVEKEESLNEGETIPIRGKPYTNNNGKITPALTEEEKKYTRIEGKTIYEKIQILRGTQQEMQRKRAEKTKENDDINIRRKDTGLSVFDGKGNYEAFRLFLDSKDVNFVQEHLPVIIKNIKEYKQPKNDNIDASENYDELRNGYAEVLTEYVTKNYTPELMRSYIDFITTENINILGVDKQARIKNYDKLIHSRNERGFWKTLDKTTQQHLIDMKLTVMEKKNRTPQEAISKGFDSLVNTFGPMLFSILSLLGMGKGTLYKRFPGSKEKIDELYHKEYGLSKEQTNAIIEISKNDDNFATTTTPSNKKLETSDEIEKEFENKKTDFIKLITNTNTNNGKKTYYQHLNINALQPGLDKYNKDNKTNKTIHDVVKIEKNTTTQKNKITGIQDENIFEAIIRNIVNDQKIWTSIAKANEEIQQGPKEGQTVNEHGLVSDDANRYFISNQQDIARYLTALLFSDKHLSYVMTENELHNQKERTNPDPTIDTEPTTTKILTFIDKNTYFDGNGKLNSTGNKKTIHEVIDVENSPEKLQIIRGTTTIDIEKKEIDETKTYVDTTKPTKRVQIFKGDKIQEIPEEVVAES